MARRAASFISFWHCPLCILVAAHLHFTCPVVSKRRRVTERRTTRSGPESGHREGLEQVNSDPTGVGKKFDTEFSRIWRRRWKKAKEAQKLAEIAMQAAHDTREHCCLLETSFDKAEVALNEGLGCMHKLVTATATATCAMSIGTGDRAEHEQDYLRNAVALQRKTLQVLPNCGYCDCRRRCSPSDKLGQDVLQ